MQTVIVGHGLSPEGRGWGERIDAADRVVRMWEWHWQQPDDYGRRYDHGIIETHCGVLKRFWDHNQRQPTKGWVASYLHQVETRGQLARIRIPDRTETWDQRLWIDDPWLGGAVGGVGETGAWELTRGGFAACWALQTSQHGDEVVMVGCDNLMAGVALPIEAGFPKAYRQAPATASFKDYKAGVTKTGNHDFPAEAELLTLLAGGRGVRLTWAA
jgi:hypothetical protein